MSAASVTAVVGGSSSPSSSTLLPWRAARNSHPSAHHGRICDAQSSKAYMLLRSQNDPGGSLSVRRMGKARQRAWGGSFEHDGCRQQRSLTLRLSIAGAGDEWNLHQEESGRSVAADEEIGSEDDSSSSPSSSLPPNGTFLLVGGEPVVVSANAGDTSPALKAGGPQGMAEAFSISARTAFGVTAGIALAALVMPLFMSSTAAGLPFKTRALSYATLLFGFYMAWNIGANDVANAMGTSVGSGALSLRQAVMTAAVLEFAGAFMVGSHVSHTMQKGILAVTVFEGKSSLLFAGMVSSLAAAGSWLQVRRHASLSLSQLLGLKCRASN